MTELEEALSRVLDRHEILRTVFDRLPGERFPLQIIEEEVHPELVFSAKTGTGGDASGSVTWLVGHVACPGRAHVFASRVLSDTPPSHESPAVAHGLAALDQLGVLRCEADGG